MTGAGSHHQAGNHDDGVRRLRDLLRAAVLRGAFVGGQLPGEAELMDSHNATRAMVRDALGLLRAEGLITRTQGVGTFSVSRAVLTEMTEAHGGSAPSRTLSEQRPRLLDRSVVPLPATAANRLGTNPDQECLRLEYVALADDEPLALATNYTLFPEAAALQATAFVSHWYALLDAAGLALGQSEFALGAQLAEARTAELLDVAPGHPVLGIEQVISDSDGRAYDLAFIVVRSDRCLFSSRAVWSPPATS